MDLGLHYWNFSIPSDPAEIAATLTSAAEIAEQEGLAEFSVVDHFFQMGHVAPADQPMLEAYATLAALRVPHDSSDENGVVTDGYLLLSMRRCGVSPDGDAASPFHGPEARRGGSENPLLDFAERGVRQAVSSAPPSDMATKLTGS